MVLIYRSDSLNILVQCNKNNDIHVFLYLSFLKDEAQARTMAVQYARVVFPADHVPSRFILLLACGDK